MAFSNIDKVVDGVYVNEWYGEPGVDWPIGTPGHPVNNDTDLRRILAARGLSKVVIPDGANAGLLLSTWASGVQFVGTIPGYVQGINATVNINGEDTSDCSFEDLIIAGDMLGAATYRNCEINSDNILGDFILCHFAGGHTLIDNSAFFRCTWNRGVDYISMGFFDVYMYKVTGSLKLKDHIGAAASYIWGEAGLELTIDATCTTGIINIYGDVKVINNSGGTVVNDYSNHKAGKTATFTKQVTAAANAAPLTLATVALQPVMIKSLVVRSNGATTADLTSIAVTGGAGGVVTFVSAAQGIRANIAAADQQVSWQGAVTLKAAGTIVMTFVGTGATALNLQVDIEYEAIVDTGYLV